MKLNLNTTTGNISVAVSGRVWTTHDTTSRQLGVLLLSKHAQSVNIHLFMNKKEIIYLQNRIILVWLEFCDALIN